MLEFHYQEKYVNVTFTDLTQPTKQVGPRQGTEQSRGHLVTLKNCILTVGQTFIWRSYSSSLINDPYCQY